MKIDSSEIIKRFDLEPLETEGGYYRRTWHNENGSVIYYLITEESWSSFHKLDIDEIWHFYAGDPVRQLQLFEDGRAEVLRISSELKEGTAPQLICPADCWQATKLATGGTWALLGTTMTPAYTENCIVFPQKDELLIRYADNINLIREFL